MTGRRQHGIVMLDSHHRYAGADTLPEFAESVSSLGIGIRQRRNDYAAVTVQIGHRRFNTATLGTGNRMRRHEIARYLAEHRSRRLDHTAFGATGVAVYRLRIPIRFQLRKDGLHAATGVQMMTQSVPTIACAASVYTASTTPNSNARCIFGKFFSRPNATTC